MCLFSVDSRVCILSVDSRVGIFSVDSHAWIFSVDLRMFSLALLRRSKSRVAEKEDLSQMAAITISVLR